MSLALIQGYSSAEEEPDERLSSSSHSANEDDEEDDDLQALHRTPSSATEKNASFDLLKPSSNSSLPSAFAAFAEVVGPPEFLNSSVVEGDKQDGERDGGGRRGKGSGRREKRELPPGAVLESKPQLLGIRDRVRSDIVASSPAITTGTVNGEGKRVISVSNPDAKDAADLLRMCLQCGIPKTYSHTRGVVCPVCGDRPLSDPLKESEKKKGSTVKDKERSKRMKGQSSHASWKSETEMQLRQQFD